MQIKIEKRNPPDCVIRHAAIAALLALTVAALTAASGLRAAEPKPAPDSATSEQDADIERAQAERLRRAIEQHERDRFERDRQRSGELSRQSEIMRLQTQIATLERDESRLQNEARVAEPELLYARRDPTDMQAMSRRGGLESRLSYYRSQLLHIAAEKQNTARRLDELRSPRALRLP